MSATKGCRRKRTLVQRVTDLEQQSVLEKVMSVESDTIHIRTTSMLINNQEKLTQALQLISDQLAQAVQLIAEKQKGNRINLNETAAGLKDQLVDLRTELDTLKQQHPPTKKRRKEPPV